MVITKLIFKYVLYLKREEEKKLKKYNIKM